MMEWWLVLLAVFAGGVGIGIGHAVTSAVIDHIKTEMAWNALFRLMRGGRK